ncbi:hypothetical protein [Adhaeribacter terreus]|uniref:Uncharacterized protein n=1 Tax=Adhaeribacter terreus TaxID=529703 RepID=A0ABW0EGA3_9BACT
MEIAIDGLVNLIKTTLLILSIPLFYIQTRKTTLDKALSLIDEVSAIVILRLSNNYLISRKDIKGIIRSKSYSKKINPKIVLVDDVINKVLEKIEENPFISKRQRRLSLEGARILKENIESKKLNFHLFIKNYEKQIYTVIILGIVFVLLLFPESWSIYENLDFKNKVITKLISYLSLSLIIVFLLIFSVNAINGLFNPKVNWGLVKIKSSTYSKIPDYYEEILKFQNEQGIVCFNLVSAEFSENENLVETDPGCLGFGIAKFYKKHQIYNLIFLEEKRENPFSIIIKIESKSFVNGMYDIDFINYIITKEGQELFNASISLPTNENERNALSNYYYLNNITSEKIENYLSFQDANLISVNGNKLIMDNDNKLLGFKLQNQIWKLLPPI